MRLTELMIIKDEIKEALASKQPVVALESTIISHGMPYPENVETAGLVEDSVRKNGAIPATIAILDGKIHIGLSTREMEFLSRSKDVNKASRADLPYYILKKLHASTTVAATMICANLAGIPIFATGGIGGVHRGAETSFDISADLQEFTKTNIAVVCAGAKAILNLPLTIEYLETYGIPLLGYQTNEFPAFYYRNSGIPVTTRVETSAEIAEYMCLRETMRLQGGIIIANPIPEQAALDKEMIECHIQLAINEARFHQIRGKLLTPYLLSRLQNLSNSKSLESNIALILNNASLASKIAVDYSTKMKEINPD